MPPATTRKPCTVCKALTTTKCGRCGLSFYCSLAHQKSDWKKHKAICITPALPLPLVVKTRAEAERDGDTKFVIDAILLPCDSDKPRLVKIVCESYADPESGFRQHRADLDPYLGPHHNTFYKSLPITSLGITGPPLGYTLTLRWRDTFLIDGSKVNQSIVKLTNGKAEHPWAGNLLAYRVDEPTSMVARCKDAKPEDLAVLAAYFANYRKGAR